jgi:hypothetical protein|tara:strand:- start:693 stop:884 length:192 start_codon:yes stop_codon:yes gene_type:complete
MMAQVLDRYLHKFVSRKLLVWAAASGLLFAGGLSSADWTTLSLVYIGSQAAVDLASVWKHGKE